MLFVYGLKSIWLPCLWPVFNQIFLMMFLSGWMRRSNVLTGAEWISDAVRPRPGREPGPFERGGFRADQRHRHARLCIQGHRQVRGR